MVVRVEVPTQNSVSILILRIIVSFYLINVAAEKFGLSIFVADVKKSTPHAELTDNTTWHLISDMEKLRDMLEIEKWQVQ